MSRRKMTALLLSATLLLTMFAFPTGPVSAAEPPVLDVGADGFWDTNGGYGAASNGVLALPKPENEEWSYVPSTSREQYFSVEFMLDFDLQNSNDLYFDPNHYMRFDFNLADPTKPYDAPGNTGYSIAIGYNRIDVKVNNGTSIETLVGGKGIVPADYYPSSSLLNGVLLKLSYYQNANGKDEISLEVDGDTLKIGNVAGGYAFPYESTAAIAPGSGLLVANKSMTFDIMRISEELPVLDVGADNFWDTSEGYGSVSNGTLHLSRPDQDAWSYVPSTSSEQYFTTEFKLDFDMTMSNDGYHWPNDSYLNFSFNLADPTKPLGADLGEGKYNSGYAIALSSAIISFWYNDGTNSASTMYSYAVYENNWSAKIAEILDEKTISMSYSRNSAGQDVITFAIDGDMSKLIGNVAPDTPLFPYTYNGPAIPAGSGFVVENRSMTLDLLSTKPQEPSEPADSTVKNLNIGNADSWQNSDYGTVSDNSLNLPRPTDDQWQYKASALDSRYFQTAFILDFDRSELNGTYNDGYYSPDTYFRYSFNLADPTKPLGADLGDGKYNSGYAVAFSYSTIEILSNDGTGSEIKNIGTALYQNDWTAIISEKLDGSLMNLSYMQNSAGQDIITLAVNGQLSTITVANSETAMFPYTVAAPVPAGSGFMVENRSMTAALQSVENINFADSGNWTMDDPSKATFNRETLPAEVGLSDGGKYAMYSVDEYYSFGTSFDLQIVPNDSVNYASGYDGYGGLEFRMTTNHNQQDGENKINSTNVTDQYVLVFVPISSASNARQVQLWAYNADKSNHYFCTANWLLTGQAVPEFDDGGKHAVSITAIDINGLPTISVMIDGVLVLSYQDNGDAYYDNGYGNPIASDVRTPSGGYLQWFTNNTQMRLTDATGIEMTVNKNDLQSAIDLAETKQEIDYTASSWAAMQTALSEAKTVLNNPDADQTAVDLAESNLRTAINSLVSRTDINNIEVAIERAEALNENDYTKASFANMEEKLEAAKEMAQNQDATSEELAQAAEELNTAVDALVNITILMDVIETAQQLQAENYYPENWTDFEEQLANAKTIIAKEDATSEEVNGAVQTLLNAMDNLKPLPTRDALQALIDLAEARKESDYTATSFAALTTALEAAKAVLADNSADQTAIDNAADALQTAIAALVAAGNSAPLQAVIDNAADLDSSGYTARTWAAFNTQLETAKQLLTSGNALQADIDAAVQELMDAMEALQPLTEITDLQMDPKDLEAVKGTDKQLIYVKKAEDGTVLYKWIFNGKTLGTTTGVNLELVFEEAGLKQNISELSDNAEGICLTTAFDQTLPGPADLTLYVGDRYQDDTTLQLYRLLDDERSLEIVAQNVSVYNGYVTAVIYQGQSYFLSDAILDAEIAQQPEDTTQTGVALPITSGFIALLAAAGLFLSFRRKKHVNIEQK